MQQETLSAIDGSKKVMARQHRFQVRVSISATLLALGLMIPACAVKWSGSPARAEVPLNGGSQARQSRQEPGKNNKAEESSPALHIGQEYTSRAGIKARVIGVPSDSRCPSDVTCVWAGNATVIVELSHKKSKPQRVRLNTNLKPHDVQYAGKTISLSDLSPYPKSTTPIAPKDYVVRLLFRPAVPAHKKPAAGPKRQT
jgi:hypothetical protein